MSALALPAMAPPYLNAHFRLSIDGLTIADFSECTGLVSEIGTEEYVEGGENRFAHTFPTRRSSPNLVLKRGSTASAALWSWYGEWESLGQVTPRDGQVLLMTSVEDATVPVRVWAFRRGFPVKVAGPDLNAQSPAVAVESIEIAHHGLSLVPVP